MSDIDRHKRNVKKMIDGGASEQEIDSYLSGEGVTAEQLKAQTQTAPDVQTPAAPVVPTAAAPAEVSPQQTSSGGGIGNTLALSTASTVDGLLNGATLGGYDHYKAAVNSVIPLGSAKFGDYKGNLEKIREHGKARDAQVPLASGASKVTGAIAGVGKVGALGALPSSMVKSKGLAAGTAGFAADGAVIAGTEKALSGGDLGEVAEASKDGALLGAAGKVLLTGLGKAGSPMTERLRGIFQTPKEKAMSTLVRAAEKGNKSPQDVTRALKSAAKDGDSEYMLLDALGEAGVRQANGISRSGGESGAIIRNALDVRQAGQSGRVVNHLDEAFGTSGKTANTAKEGITKKLRATDDANYSKVPSQPVPPEGALSYIKENTKSLAAGLKPTKSEKFLNEYQKMIQSGGSSTVDVKRLIEIRKDVSASVRELYRSGDDVSAGKLKKLQRAIDDDIEKVSSAYREANAASSKIRSVRDSIDDGAALATRGRADDVVKDFNSRNKEQQTAFLKGMGDTLAGRAEAQAVTANAARPLINARMNEIVSKIVPDSQGLARKIQREQEMFANRARITGGSQTADNLADIGSGVLNSILRGDFKSAIGTTVIKAGNNLAGMNEASRKEIALMLTKNSDDAFVKAAAEKVRRGEKLTQQQTRLVYSAIAVGAISGNQ